MKTTTLLTVLALSPALGAGCATDDGEPKTEITKSTRASLQWKRNVALERDLMRALELTEDQVCMEQGRDSCTRAVHHIALGGSDPLTIGLYEPLPDTLVSTPVVFDRVVLSACAHRATMDAAGDAVVFGNIDFDLDGPEAGTEEFTKVITSLYRRLLSREPASEELDILEKLTVDPDGDALGGYDFAVLSCFAIGTTTEFLFF